MGVFKTYDIRGVWGEGIDAALSYRIGRAFARFLGGSRYIVGYDARKHSREMYERVAAGLVDEGKAVTGIGMVSTPLLHHAEMQGKYDGALMVTASHNPPPYQGAKLYDGGGGSVSYAKGLDRVERIANALTGREEKVPGGSFSETDPVAQYAEFVCSPLGGRRPRSKFVVDVSNGSAGRVFRAVVERLGADALLINEKPDGSFPNHSPNPLEPESMHALSSEVVRRGADFGVILDGDGDRLLFVDEKGQRIENYFLSVLIAEELLQERPGAAVVYDLISSRVLPERIRELGGKPVVSRVGYTFLYDAMVASGAVFGSETSGHVYFRVTERYYTESAAYAMVVLLRLLDRRRGTLSGAIDPLRGRYYQMPETNLEVRDKEGALEAVRRTWGHAELEELDGVSVSLPEYWFNVRPSNTEPVLRVRLEAVDRETAEGAARKLTELLGSM